MSLAAFDFSGLQEALKWHVESYKKDELRSPKQKHLQWAKNLESAFEPHKTVADKFVNQLQHITSEKPLDLNKLLSRLTSAKDYFYPILEDFSKQIFTHGREVAKEKGLKKYITELNSLESIFYSRLQTISKALKLVDSAIQKIDITAENFRDETEMKQRSEAISNAAKRQKKPKAVKGQTQQESFLLFKQGKTIAEIAEMRGFAQTTIEGHLARYVTSGELDVHDFIKRKT
jgi:hypothetical protein